MNLMSLNSFFEEDQVFSTIATVLANNIYINFSSHEDIKDAMLSLVHMMRENTEKLERHEARERQLGDQLKKTITILTKRVSAVDLLKVQLTKLDERIGGIEHLIAQVITFS